MTRRHTSIRLSEYTDQQINELADLMGASAAEIIARAVDHYYQERMQQPLPQQPPPKKQPNPQT